MAAIIMMVYFYTVTLLFCVWMTRQIINYKKDTYYARMVESKYSYSQADLEVAYEKGRQANASPKVLVGPQGETKHSRRAVRRLTFPESFSQGYAWGDPSDTSGITDERW
jgi:hypothetical protein